MWCSVVAHFSVLLLCSSFVLSCDEATCGSLISKCQLIEACSCTVPHVKTAANTADAESTASATEAKSRAMRSTDAQPMLPAAVAAIENCTCCADCYRCVRNLYFECCDCVGMCPSKRPHVSDYEMSTIGELAYPRNEVFKVLTSDDDIHGRFTVHTYPAHIITESHVTSSLPPPAICRVAFLTTCTSLSTCKSTCEAMGAAKFRWFHEQTCCQCVGTTCIDYGLSRAACVGCQTSKTTIRPEIPLLLNQP